MKITFASAKCSKRSGFSLTTRFANRKQWVLIAALFLAVALVSSPASALITTKTPAGSNHAAAHVAPHASTGASVPIGIIEIGGGVDPAKTSIDNDGRLIKNLNFIGVATPVLVEPGGAALNPNNPIHATQVTDIVGSSDANYLGVAPGANMYVGAVRTSDEIFGAPVWYNNQSLVGIFNYSLGGVAFGFQSQRNHTGNLATLTNAGDFTNITGMPFNFNVANFQSIDQLDYRFNLNDADVGPGEFDINNLRLNIGGVIITPFNATIATDNVTIEFTGSYNLTPADRQTLTTTLTNNAGDVHIRLEKIANGGVNDVTPTNDPGGFNLPARLQLFQFNDNGNNKLTRALDWFATATDSVQVVSAGNDGDITGQVESPGDLWNGISVGALQQDFTARVDFSGYRQSVGKGKPDVMAPGENIWTEFIPGNNGAGDGTSFAAPHVTGIAGLLEAGTENTGGLVHGLGGGRTRHLATKAIILNSARKRFAVEPENGVNLDIKDNAATNAEAADGNYLNGNALRNGNTGGAPKTASWTPSSWSYNQGANLFITTDPLDDELGTGLADAERALIQLDGGQQAPGNVTPIGWDLRNVGSASFLEYVLDFKVNKGDFVTTTLDWDRLITRTDDGDGHVDFADTFDLNPVADLDLVVTYQGNFFASSASLGNNVEHLHVPFMIDGDPGDYAIRVYNYSLAAVDYGLAWWTTPIPEPTSVTLFVLGVFLLAGRRRDARA